MSWPEIRLENWTEFTQATLGKASLFGADLYRGQAQDKDEWGLRPSLARAAAEFNHDAASVIMIERLMMAQFQQAAHLHLPTSVLPKDTSSIDWLMIMQHHRAPTRLLDWTESPYVAAYFACIDDWDCDGVIWWFQKLGLEARMKEKYGDTKWRPMLEDADAPLRIHPIRGTTATERMLAQKGAFTMCTQVLADHCDAIETAASDQPAIPPRDFYGRWIIPAKEKPAFLVQLRAANITAASLFPGADGLGLELREFLMMRMDLLHSLREQLESALKTTAFVADSLLIRIKRETVNKERLLELLNESLHDEGLHRQQVSEDCRFDGPVYQLQEPDETGCNWSDDLTMRCSGDAAQPSLSVMARAVQEVRQRYNLAD